MADTLIAPAEPKPSPAPSPTPAPSPAPAPAPSPTPSPARADDPFSALHSSIKAPALVTAKTKEEAAKGAAAPAAKPAAPTSAPKELRTELERVKGELSAATASRAELERRIADAEARGKDTAALTAQLESEKQERLKLLAELRAIKQEASPEFKAKFDKPFEDASAMAEQDIKSMQVLGEDGMPVRQGTFNDLKQLWLTYKESPAAGIAQARKMFGDDHQIVTDHLKELRRLDYTRTQALAEERKNFQANQEKENADAITQREQIGTLWKQTNQELADTVDEYHDAPDDKELIDLRRKGYELYDAKPATMQQRVLRDAHVRQIVAAFGPMKLKLIRAEQQLAERDAKIAELEGTKPSGGKRTGGDRTTASEETWEEATRKALLP